ncbi:MAG: OmpH family outer membrane protein, partial [Bacteroidia bacterium]
MNKISLALNAVLLIAVAILFFLYFSLNSKLSPSSEGTSEAGKKTPKLITDPSKLANAKIAYINIDSLNSKYQFITDKSQEINKRQMALENTLNSMYGKFQQEVADLQQAAQAGLRSETELKKEEERLQIKQQDIANKEKQLQALGEEVANTQANMLRSVSIFIEKYNDNKFDYI